MTNWYKIAKEEELKQQTFDFYKDIPQSEPKDKLPPEYEHLIGEVNPNDPSSVEDALQDVKGIDNIINIFKYFMISWDKVNFKSGPVLTVNFTNNKLRKSRAIYVLDDFDYPDLKEANDWLYGIWDHDLHNYIEQEDVSFWDEVENGSKLYHATSMENKNDIVKNGLRKMNKTRGISNRGTPSAVFTSENPDDISSYGDLIFEIDVGMMKKDNYMPSAEKEEPIQESQLRETIAHMIGVDNFSELNDLANEGISSSTVVIYGEIPPKYLKIYQE